MTSGETAGASPFHEPVMVAEVLEYLNARSGMVVVDTTLGGGGHADAILKVIAPDGLLIGIDRDADAIFAAKKHLLNFSSRIKFVKGRMSDLSAHLDALGIEAADGILADLGVSSFQLDFKERGLSFMGEAPLDMRMDRENGETAKDLLMRLDEEEIGKIIWELGEERYARRIAREIARYGEINTTTELVELIVKAIPPHARHKKIHPATRTFQALRIAINDEMGELKKFLESAPKRLSPGGRLVIISYHSLEDRQVKHSFRAYAKSSKYRLPLKRVLIPSEEEIAKNLRARSAKLRVLERISL